MRWTACVAVLAIIACGEREQIDVGSLTQNVVYGVDDRQEVFEHPDPNLVNRAINSTVALISRVRFVDNGDGTFSTSSPPLGQRDNLCFDERFAEQPTAASCSGVLIDNDLVLTAGHCVDGQAACDSFQFVFDYRFEAADQLATIEADDIYACSRVVVREKGASGIVPDFAVVQLDRPVTDSRVPAPIRPTDETLQVGDSVAMIGFGAGVPAKIDSGAEVVDPRVREADYFLANVDAFLGHSGSPVFDSRGRLAGILVAGRDPDLVLGPAGDCNVVNAFTNDQGEEAVHYIDSIVEALCDSGRATSLCEGGACAGSNCPPDDWTCSPGRYGSGSSCDCNCGAFDPDCDNVSLQVDGCLAAETCDGTGVCKRLDNLPSAGSSLVGTCAIAPGRSGVPGWVLGALGVAVAARRRQR